MTAQILDGKAVAAKERQRSAARAADFVSKFGRAPGLAVVKVGEDPASAVYVRNKRRACEECGIASFAHDLPATTSRGELLGLIDRLNRDDAVDGILLQLPLPRGLDSTEIMDTIDPAKDVHGFHPTYTGLLAQKRRLRPCTPWGVMRLLKNTPRRDRAAGRGRGRIQYRRPAHGAGVVVGTSHGHGLPHGNA